MNNNKHGVYIPHITNMEAVPEKQTLIQKKKQKNP